MKNEPITEETEATAMSAYHQAISKEACWAENNRFSEKGDKFSRPKSACRYVTGHGDVGAYSMDGPKT